MCHEHIGEQVSFPPHAINVLVSMCLCVCVCVCMCRTVSFVGPLTDMAVCLLVSESEFETKCPCLSFNQMYIVGVSI